MLRAVPAAAAVGALGIAIPTAAGAPVAAPADPAPTGTTVEAAVQDASLRPGQPVAVSGRLVSGQAGAPVRLEVRPAGQAAWTALTEGTTGPDGRFALRASLRRSGQLRVVPAGVAAAAEAGAVPVGSAPLRVRVGAKLKATSVRRNVTAGSRALVRGALNTRGAGRTVALQLHGKGGWRTVDRDRTDAGGRFRLAERLASPTSKAARLRFAGDALNAAAHKRIGRVTGFRSALASWYGPGLYGNPLGCGGTLSPGTMGVAHKTLPCGTKLTLRYRGNVVRTRVVDRGPYVGAREFDLTSATKSKLGFGSVGTIQVSV